ncbi:MAG: hypothetical protein ACK5H2_13530 [Beutenbergiaceae bacterium]
MSSPRTGALAGVVAMAILAGCAAPQPAVAVGFDGTDYLGIVVVCDERTSFTSVSFEVLEGAGTGVTWVGRTDLPVTYYRLGTDAPDNWISTGGGLVSGTEYRFTATGDGVDAAGAPFTVADLSTLGPDQVIDAAGQVRAASEFLDTACS